MSASDSKSDMMSVNDGVVSSLSPSLPLRMRNGRVMMLFLLTLTTTSLTSSVKGLSLDRRTKYGCEGTTLEIQCEAGTVINLVRANFGRFSISICNDIGNTDWSVNCMEPRTLRVINSRCNMKPRCKIPVDAAIFGDPCPGTNKYVEVHYTCQPVKQDKTTPKALPPWLLDLAATPASISTSTTTTTTTTTSTSPTPASTSSAPTTQSHSSPGTTPPMTNMTQDMGYIESPTTDPTILVDLQTEDMEERVPNDTLDMLINHCPPQTVRNLFWNWTESGQEAIQVCPPGSSGFARWSCSSEGVWSSETPNLSECQSLWLSRLESRMHAIGSRDTISSELAALTEERSLYGGDIPIVTSVIQGLAHRLRQELYVIPSDEEKEAKVSELLQNVLKTASNLLEDEQIQSWQDLGTEKSNAFATALMVGIEESALLLAQTINNEKNLMESTNNILASIRVLRAREVSDQLFPVNPDDEADTVNSSEEISWLQVATKSLVETSENGAVRIVFFLYNNLEKLLPGLGSKRINSKVLGASVNQGRAIQLKHPVLFTLYHLNPVEIWEPVCATWDYSNRSWDAEQCQVLHSNSSATTCQCHRIANYVVLSEVKPPVSAEPHAASGKLSPHFSTIIFVVLAVVLAILLLIVVFIVIRRFDLKPRVQKFVQANSPNGIFRCKKSESTTSSCGFYPPLTSSPTSTTVSSGTPTNQTYLEQVLKAAHNNSDFHQIKPQQPGPQQMPSSQSHPMVKGAPVQRPVFRGTPTGRHLIALNQCDPYGHHIYMEIDPVYAHLDSSETAVSDIQLSDISDDDLRLRSSHPQRFAEERPLIRSNHIRRNGEPNHDGSGFQKTGLRNPHHHQFMTTHRGGGDGGVATVSNSANSSFRMAHTAQRRPGHRPLIYPVVSGANGRPSVSLEAPITIALQGGDQFVSLKIDPEAKHEDQHPSSRSIYH